MVKPRYAKLLYDNNLIRLIYLLLLPAALSITIHGAETDTTSVTALREVLVTTTRPAVEVIPSQRLSGDDLKKLNSNTVADALRYFSGIQIKDYGGIGGVKTANVRSMGTNHTGVVYDGVELGNAQNGQIDLGQFSLDNIEAISLYNGQKSEILQPARDFGTAASIYMRTRTPHFAEGQRWHARFTFRTGAFALVNPSVLLEARLSKRLTSSLNVEWLKSNGKYKFHARKYMSGGTLAYDTVAVRQNGDLEALRAEFNLIGELDGGEWRAKIYHYDSQRGIPGAIVNNVWRRGERQWDNNSFAQFSLSKYYGRLSFLSNAKYSYYRTRYINNDITQIKVDNLYRQQEAYGSLAAEYLLLPTWRLALSYDFQWNALQTDIYGFVRPDRFTHFAALATALSLPRFKAQASAMGTFIRDKVRGRNNVNRRAFTPAVYLSAYPLRTRDFILRAFVKRSFRMPTFNDLYYAEMGNSALNPEQVTQYNFGTLYEHASHGFFASWRVSADAYINRVKDKIVAYPRGAQFRWTMLNLGLVDIKGVDATTSLTLRPTDGLMLTIRGQYTYQYAIDITSVSDSYYRDQIPYIPRHSASAVLNTEWRHWSANVSYIYVGKRYSQPENTAANLMDAWHTTDLSLCRDFTFNRIAFRAMLELNNVFGQSYEVVRNYPMPGRNLRLTFRVDF